MLFGMDELDAETCPLDTLADEVCFRYAGLTVAMAAWLRLLAVFDRRGGWHGIGLLSCAHWLTWRCAISLHTAREHLRVAHALEALPRVASLFAEGRLSYSKVRAITRIADASTEAVLVDFALAGTAAHLDRIVAAWRRYGPAESPDVRQACEDRRELSWYRDDDGSVVARLRLPPVEGALFLAAVRAHLDEQPRTPDEHPDPTVRIAQRRADAVVAMAHAALDAVPDADGEHHQVMVHIDARLLADPEADGICHLDHGEALDVSAVERLLCTTGALPILEAPNGSPLNVGAPTRHIPRRLRRAVRHRDGGCRFPGCTHHRFLDVHHLHRRGLGGGTDLGNLLALCPRHHRAVHELGFGVSVDPTSRQPVFTSPRGRVIPGAPGPPLVSTDADRHAPPRRGHLLTPGWGGERLDLNLALLALATVAPTPAAAGP
jgi:hypothetical protein